MSKAQKISRSDILQARRQVLIARCRLQRQQLIWQSAELHHELRFIELGLNAARTLRASPLLVATLAVVTAGLALIKPRRTLWLVKTGFSSWRLWRRFAPTLMPLIPVLRDWLVSAKETSAATSNDTQTKE